MKTKYFNDLLAVWLVGCATCATLNSCKDQPDEFELTDGTPTINYIRPASASASDSLLVEAYPQATICLVGSNLTSIQQMYFNDKKAILNTSFITENTLIVQVPSDIPDLVTDKIYLITEGHDTLTYDFHIVIPAPVVSQMSCEYATPGSVATIYGSYFIDDPNVPLTITFPDGKTAEIKSINASRSTVSFVVPECTTEGQITVKSIYGSGKSSFRFLDSRGMLFDFDNGNAVTGAVLGCHGWHNGLTITDAENPISGKYLILGNATLDEDGSWDDGNFAFEYWPGNWQDPEDYQGDGVRLTDLADFSDYMNMSYKFEMCIPKANPWMSGAMQFIVGGVTKISMGSNDPKVKDIYGNLLAGCNNTYFNNDELPRGIYRPWEATGSYDTADEWITVTLPISEFKYGMSGGAATGSLSSSDFTSLLIFVVGGGIKGTECTPIIKIDNVRAVPNK
ncbi:MAG: hypothetical protein J6Z14_05140 [Prevotella sp.]|nr:hypothetical protein [Prevotella sp.]